MITHYEFQWVGPAVYMRIHMTPHVVGHFGFCTVVYYEEKYLREEGHLVEHLSKLSQADCIKTLMRKGRYT